MREICAYDVATVSYFLSFWALQSIQPKALKIPAFKKGLFLAMAKLATCNAPSRNNLTASLLRMS